MLSKLFRCASGICAGTFLLMGCGGGQVSTAGAAVPKAAAPATPTGDASGKSWMKPNVSGNDLLYISDEYANVYAYTYPQGKLVGTLTGFISPLGECVDAAGDVFIVSFSTRSYQSSIISEYAHGGTEPIAILEDPGPAGACAVDARKGNLAVAGGYEKLAAVAVYPNAQGNPTIYSTSQFHRFYFCGYDDLGNLYLSAEDPYSDDEELARLASGSAAFEQVKLDTKFYGTADAGASVQWDGRHMTVTSYRQRHEPLLVYRLSISGSTGKVIGTTQLSSEKNHYIGQTWIQARTYIAMDVYKNNFKLQSSLWRYPRGGAPFHSIAIASGGRWGLVVSPGHGR